MGRNLQRNTRCRRGVVGERRRKEEMRYEIKNLEDEVIYETDNLRAALSFTQRYAKENPTEFRVLLYDDETNQVIALILKNGKIRKVHHYLHEKRMDVDQYHRLVNQNLETVEKAATSLGYSPEIEYDPEGSFLRKSSNFHRNRLKRFIELGAPRVIIENERRAIRAAEEEERERE